MLKSHIKESTRYIRQKVVEKNIRPFFGKLRPAGLPTDQMDKYREKRKPRAARMRQSIANCLSYAQPKFNAVPYFPMVQKVTIRKGFPVR